MYRKINPKKIKDQRGDLTRKKIAELSGLSEQQIGQYEKVHGGYKPSEASLPYLLKALGCSYEDISDEVELSIAA